MRRWVSINRPSLFIRSCVARHAIRSLISGHLPRASRRAADGSLDLKETDDLLDIVPILESQLAAAKESLIAHKAKMGK